MKKQQAEAFELARRKFFIPAARNLMDAYYTSHHLKTSNLATNDLSQVLESSRDVWKSAYHMSVLIYFGVDNV